CNDAILDCCAILGEPRHCLGIVASARGFFGGRIKIRGEGCVDWQDPQGTGGSSGLAVTSDWLTKTLEMQSDARCILVVEKDGIFNRLLQDGFFNRSASLSKEIPCILVTGQGFPPLAVRACVHRLAKAFQLPVFGLSDCNPFGLALLLVYKLGSVRLGVDASKYAVPDLRWLGLRPSQLDDLQLTDEVFQDLKTVDLARANSLSTMSFILNKPEGHSYGREVDYWKSTITPGDEKNDHRSS
ncbi:unnamed protein product, partial [Choristocarpus tenellus]